MKKTRGDQQSDSPVHGTPGQHAGLRAVCVFCGSREGDNRYFAEAARALGVTLAEAGLRLVFGGGSIGLMGHVARAALAAGGHVTGVIPRHLARREVMMEGLSALHVVESMHDRKRTMFELSDAFVTLPGGIGTLDETIEIIVWRQLRLHDKPIVLVNEENYWAPFLDMIGQLRGQGFGYARDMDLFDLVPSVNHVIPALHRAHAPQIPDAPELT